MLQYGMIRLAITNYYEVFYLKKVALAFFALKNFFLKTCILSINCYSAMRLKYFEAQLRFAYCVLGAQIACCFCGETVLKLRTHPCMHCNPGEAYMRLITATCEAGPGATPM